jgi:hypothetical protein
MQNYCFVYLNLYVSALEKERLKHYELSGNKHSTNLPLFSSWIELINKFPLWELTSLKTAEDTHTRFPWLSSALDEAVPEATKMGSVMGFMGGGSGGNSSSPSSPFSWGG